MNDKNESFEYVYKIDFIERYAPKKVKKAFKIYKIITEKYKNFFDNRLTPNLLPGEKKNFEKAQKEILSFCKKFSLDEHFIERFNKIKGINFWRHEYIKRHYYLEKCASNPNCHELEEIQALNRIREKYNEIILSQNEIKGIDCDLNNCYFLKKGGQYTEYKDFLRFPFFYNTKCVSSCIFKYFLMRDIIYWHNVTNSDFLCQFNDFRFEKSNSYGIVKQWDDEYKKDINVLHNLSYHYGLYAFELFALASSEMIMNNSLSKNGINLFEGYIRPETFLKKDDNFKLSDPDNMDYFFVGFDFNKEYIDSSASKIETNSLVIAIDLLEDDFSIKKAVSFIKKKLETKENQKLYAPKIDENQYRQLAVFLFKSESTTLRVVDCLNDVETILKAVSTYNKPFINQLIEEQNVNLELYEKADNIKHYQDRDRSRLIGLYIWDQIHLLNKPCAETIRSFADSKLFERIMKLTDGEIDQRILSAKAKGREGSCSNKEEREEIFRNYEYANCCIEKGDILTGEKCERILYPNRHS